jgi:hypothetical protein
MALLDAILDGLVDPENGSLREFCADCFAEFMRWSVRHAPPEVTGSPVRFPLDNDDALCGYSLDLFE